MLTEINKQVKVITNAVQCNTITKISFSENIIDDPKFSNNDNDNDNK